MPFALLDDKFHSNGKVMAAGNAGAGLYARALSYCADHLTDGFVPDAWARHAGTKTLVDKLTKTGLWRPVLGENSFTIRKTKGVDLTITVTGKGFFIPDYLEHNPTRAEVEAKRKTKAEAGRKGAHKRWQTDSSGMAPATELLSRSHSVGNAPRFPVVDLNTKAFDVAVDVDIEHPETKGQEFDSDKQDQDAFSPTPHDVQQLKDQLASNLKEIPW